MNVRLCLPQPVLFPLSVFNQDALKDDSVRWTRHECKSFHCLNTRLVGDCRNCFNMSLENRRWLSKYRGSLTAADVLDLKRGSIRWVHCTGVSEGDKSEATCERESGVRLLHMTEH